MSAFESRRDTGVVQAGDDADVVQPGGDADVVQPGVDESSSTFGMSSADDSDNDPGWEPPGKPSSSNRFAFLGPPKPGRNISTKGVSAVQSSVAVQPQNNNSHSDNDSEYDSDSYDDDSEYDSELVKTIEEMIREEERVGVQGQDDSVGPGSEWVEFIGRQKQIEFTGSSGLQINVPANITPLQAFEMIVDNEILDLLYL